ncbi:substance-K receptor-like [Porites lutea]|uniref:substance-K receptor-like n=1 Tax=Porites lutea TaxID=51062 RepID=UPI003CC65C2E
MTKNVNLALALFYGGIPFLIIGLIGNLSVIRIVHKTREMHTTTNYLLVSMTVSDVITVLLWPLYHFSFAKFVCKFTTLAEISIMVSSSTLTVLAVERYHAILKPLEIELRLNKDNIKRAIAFIWIASLIICFPEFFLREWSETYSGCIGPWTLQMNEASKIYVAINLIITYMQIVVTFSCYGWVIKGLYFSKRAYPETDRDTTSEKKKLVITLTLATTGFLVGYTPYLWYFWAFKVTGSDRKEDILLVADFFFVCSLSLNPMIYGFRGRKFREGLKRMLFWWKPTTQNETPVELNN